MTPDQLPLEEFLEEADDLIQELESSLLELESNLEDRSIIDRIFRAMHTIKGESQRLHHWLYQKNTWRR